MAVIDDVRRLIQLDFMFLGMQLAATLGGLSTTTWHKGRLQQANDGAIIFRSISQDGTMVGVQLGAVQGAWTSSESIGGGVQVTIPVAQGGLSNVSILFILGQSLPQELT